MKKTRDYERGFRGLWSDGGVCRVRLYEDETGTEAPVIVLSELPSNENTSVTYIVEVLAAEVAEELGVVRAGLRVVEHYPRTDRDLRDGLAETFDLVSFSGIEAAIAGFVEVRRVNVGGVTRPSFGEPDGEHLARAEVARLLGEDIGGEVLPEPERAVEEPTERPYRRVEAEHGMLPPLPWDHESGDVVLERVPDFEGGLDLCDNLKHKVRTNVPWSVVEHSPDGLLWGYNGAGPADLALNILNLFEPVGADGQEPVVCWDGQASQTAHALHQRFKADFLVGMPWEGGTISGANIRAWISERVVRADGVVIGYSPRGARAV